MKALVIPAELLSTAGVTIDDVELNKFDAFAIRPLSLPPLVVTGAAAAPKPVPKPKALGAFDAIGG